MSEYHGMTLGEARDLNVREVAHEIEDLFYRQPFRVPAQFAFAGRAVGTLSGLATGLAPEFNLVEVAVPYAQTFLGLNREGAGQTVQQVFRQVVDAGRVSLGLPATMERVLAKLEAGELEVQFGEDGRNGTSRGGRRSSSARRSSSSLVVPLIACVALLGAGVALATNQLFLQGWFCLGLGALATVALVVRR
jgi:predicted unusual protein kinase regulating ubiquinone biosynthesis (AarF/ABC1/UbiB family)